MKSASDPEDIKKIHAAGKAALQQSVAKIDGLTVTQEKNFRRKNQADLQKTYRRIKQSLLWVGFAAFVWLVVAVVVLVALFVYDVYENNTIAMKIESFLAFCFGAFFTLAIERVARRAPSKTRGSKVQGGEG